MGNVHIYTLYSTTFDKRPLREKGTTSLQRTALGNAPSHGSFLTSNEKDNLSTEDKVADPKVSFIPRFHLQFRDE